MPKPQKTEYKKQEVIKVEFTSKEFFDLERELEKYAIDTEQKIKGIMTKVHYVSVKGIQKWYIDHGALSNRDQWTVCNIPLFQELQDKMEQYENWQKRRTYAKNKELEGLEELSTQMQIN